MIRMMVRVGMVGLTLFLLVTVLIPAAVRVANMITPTGITDYPWSTPKLLTGVMQGRPLPTSTIATTLIMLTVLVVLLLVVLAGTGVGVGPAGRSSIVRLRLYVWWKSKPKRQPLTAKAAEPLGRIGWFGFFGMRWFTDMLEETRVLIAPSGAGKTVRMVVQLIFRARGAVLATSTKTDVLRLTGWVRKVLNPFSQVMAFDPEGLVPWMYSVKWDIVAGCEDNQMAIKRAAAIVAARPLNGSESSNSSFFNTAVTIVLQCMLHAAAIKGLSMREVMAWMNDFDDNTPYTILRYAPGANRGWEALLKKYCRGKADETVSSTDMSASGILNAFSIESILEAVCPAPGEPVIDIARFHRSRDTLYLVCKGEKSPASSIFTSLVESMYVLASDDATRTGPIVPPLELILDEVANVCAIPSLPGLMSTGRGEGIAPTAVVQDYTQLAARYGAETATTIVNNATELLVMGGLKDAAYLQSLSDLAGNHRSGSGQYFDTRVIAPEKIGTLWDGRALFFYRNQPPTIITLPAWWRSKHRADYQTSLKWADLEQERYARADTATADRQAS